jgi:hypothetical protein
VVALDATAPSIIDGGSAARFAVLVRFNAKLARLIGDGLTVSRERGRAAGDGVVDFPVDGRGGLRQTTLINNRPTQSSGRKNEQK